MYRVCFANSNKICLVLCMFVTVVFGMAVMSNLPPKTAPRVCVIGAGISGLASARYLKEAGIDFTVLEATRYIGGTWRYDPRVGVDEDGQPLHTSMYEELRTNLPKVAMQLHGFPAPADMPSFPSWQVYYEYLQSFAKHFNLEKHVQFSHLVTSVRKNGNVWKVKHKHVLSGEQFSEEYDYVFVGNGHHSTPNYPSIPGEKKFKGTIIHSHDYRKSDPFKDRRVLIIGAGPSGMDINLIVAEIAKTLVHSHHSKVPFRTPFPPNYVHKPDVKEFTENGAIFEDGTFEKIDDVIYCTGYQYSVPFLDETSGLTMTSKYVVPLYRYMVNIHEPTMLFFGLVVRACLVAAIDAQARYATALVAGNFTLPSKEIMMEEWHKRQDHVTRAGRPMSDIHLLADKEDQYYEDLSKESGSVRVPPVLFKVRTRDTSAKLENLYTYRNYDYVIVDNNTFTRTYTEPVCNKRIGCTP